MSETFFYYGSRDAIKAKAQELVRSGKAAGMRPNDNDSARRLREIARAQLLFTASDSLGLGVSYEESLTCVQGIRLSEPSEAKKE